ncbi:MAG: tetratricopeptide repeat protein [Candidatus Cloacimonetes bacterium]|nr:tetratricopeptide repeat protein [Candidatus Cloacimonadota bacterium]
MFDYKCSQIDKDPFFALIKEFHAYVDNSKKLKRDLEDISGKLRDYLVSEHSEVSGESSGKELEKDFVSARDFIIDLSEVKPLVFIIRAGYYITKETIDFVNFISKDIIERQVLIIISVDDPSKVRGLIHSIQVRVNPFTSEQIKEYLNKLVNETVPDSFVRHITQRTSGNPLFIRDIIIDLTESKTIWHDGRFHLDYNFEEYELPAHLTHSIFNRMSHLSEKAYYQLQKLAIIYTPISRELMGYVLDIGNKELFMLINEAVNNELLTERGIYYYLAFEEFRKRLLSECPDTQKLIIANKVLDYFQDKSISQLDVCEGIIKAAEMVEDAKAVRRYKLILARILSKKFEQVEAFDLICEVIQLDFSGKLDLEKQYIMSDLALLQEKAEITGFIHKAMEKISSIPNIPELFEKYYLHGTFHHGLGEIEKAREMMTKALSLAVTGKQRISGIIQLIWNAYRSDDSQTAHKYIDMLENVKMSPALEVAFINRKALTFNLDGKADEAINLVEDYLSKLPIIEDTTFLIRLGSLHNNLAIIYTEMWNIEDAHKHYMITKEIWEKVKNIRALGVIYNNIGDLALKQGDTKTAFEYFQKAYEISMKVNQNREQALALVNFGEAYIKRGDFREAEKYLKKGQAIIETMERKDFLDSVYSNLALAKGKIKGFGHYYQFIQEFQPTLLKNVISKLTPLVKTWFYYQFHLGNIDKLNELLQENPDIDYVESHDEDFYYQVVGLMHFLRKDYQAALHNFEIASEYAARNHSAYGTAIMKIREAQCHIGLGEPDKAETKLQPTISMVKEFDFRYWDHVLRIVQCDIDLQKPEVPLRRILRNLLAQLPYIMENDLYQLEIRVYERLVQIYNELDAETQAATYFSLYQDKIENCTQGIPPEDKVHYIQMKEADKQQYSELKTLIIAHRGMYETEEWQEQLYDLFKLNDINRMKFFIDKTIQNLISPYCYSIILYDDFKNRGEIFLLKEMDMNTIYSSDIFYLIEQSLDQNEMMYKTINKKNYIFAPLKIRQTKVGSLIIADNGELPFSETEKRVIKSMKLHLTSILMRINEFAELSSRMQMMEQLMNVSQEFLSIYDLAKLEQEIVSFAIDFTRCTRGFLIKKDEYGNYLWSIALDESKHLLNDSSYISKTVLSEVQSMKQPIYTINALIDNTFKNSISVQDYTLHSIYCAPIYVNKEFHGYLYLDNYDSPQEELYVNTSFMDMFLLQTEVAIKNALQYSQLMKKNQELHSLDSQKDHFISIVSHELNNPLITLQGYVRRLRREKEFEDEAIRSKLNKVEDSVERLISTTTDIVNLNRYNMLNSIDKELSDIKQILNGLRESARKVSETRKMNIELELPGNLPLIHVNQEAIRMMIFNLVMNAIRFTKDFGTIRIGARMSSFPKEEIDGKKTIVLYVQDNGIGIPAEELDNVFKKFYELNRLFAHKSGSIEFRSGGLGLGLATVKKISELHNGKIWLRSKEGEGTTVFIALPIEKNTLKEES